MDDLESRLNSILNDPDSMEQILSMAKSLSGAGTETPPQTGTPLDGMDPELLRSVTGIMSSMKDRENNKRSALLSALEGYLDPGRIGKARRALRMMDMAKAAKAAIAAKGGGDGSV